MIIVKIFQGPGNQLFQYAYGLAAAKRVGAELKLDLSWFKENSSHRSYILDRFNIKTSVASSEEIEYIKSLNGRNFFEYRFNILRNKLSPRHRKAVSKEDLSKFDKAIMLPYKNSYVEGYFSTEKFFEDFRFEIIESLQFVAPLPSEVQEVAKRVNNSTVACSIRRGDFLKSPLHNICSIEYYKRAINCMKQIVENPQLLIFSDEIDWVKSNMKFDVSHHFVENIEDHMDHMRLMGLCKNHIIPNSTFSWWGAWLSEPEVVVAPQFWLNPDKNIHEETFGHWVETNHTIPESWIRIPTALKGEKMMKY